MSYWRLELELKVLISKMGVVKGPRYANAKTIVILFYCFIDPALNAKTKASTTIVDPKLVNFKQVVTGQISNILVLEIIAWAAHTIWQPI